MTPLRTMLLAALLPVAVGCVQRAENEVVVYCALDQEFAEPILHSFERSTDGEVGVAPRFDVESTKTVGLVNRIFAERERPACDVFWNNEILHTVRLQQAGLLEPHDWPVGAEWPQGYIASDRTWVGFAARARILIVNRQRLEDEDEWPTSVRDLADPRWQGQCGIARPLFGTTATHAAVLDTAWGSETAEAFFRDVADNAVVLSGNKQVAQAVSSGQLAWGITDTDDAIVEKEHGLPVAIVWPDQQPGQPGVLRIPNTLCILKGAPHPVAARQLVDYLLRPETEDRLAMGDSAQIPLHREAQVRSRIEPETPVRWMEADFETAAGRWDDLAERLEAIF